MSEAIEQAKARLQQRMQAGQAKAVDPETIKKMQAGQVKAGDNPQDPQGACFFVNIFTGDVQCYPMTMSECNSLGGEFAQENCPS